MKKLLALLMAVLMLVALASCSDEDNETMDGGKKEDEAIVTSVTKNGDTFHFVNVDSETVAITKFESENDKAHEVTIPAYLDGKLVVCISEEAFASISNISKIHFPTEADFLAGDETFDIAEYTLTIEPYAFRNCDALTEIEIPAYVSSIGEAAFCECVSLVNLTFAEGSKLTEIAPYLFMDCEALIEVTIPAGVLTIGRGAFFSCDELVSVSFEEGTAVILKQAFQNCAALETVNLPATLVSIGSDAFAGSEVLTEVNYAGDSEEVKNYIDELNLPEI